MPYAPSLGCLLKLNEEIQEPLTFRSNALLIVWGMCWFNFINWKKVKANLPYEKQLWRCWLEPLCLEKVLLLREGEELPQFTAWSIYPARKTDLLWNDLAPRSQFWKDSWKTLQWFRSNLCSSDSHEQRDGSSKPFLSWWLKLISWSQPLSVEVRWEGGGGEEALHRGVGGSILFYSKK